MEYAVEGHDWIRIDPLDGVADSGLEEFRLIMPHDRNGTGLRLIFRGIDRSGNVSVEMVAVGGN